MVFCTKCGKQAEDGVKFCASCGKAMAQAHQPAAPAQPQQQNIQQAQPDSKPPKDKKKKGKTPFIIGGGAVVVAALVCVLVFTNLFGILDKPNGGENNGGKNNSNGVGYYIGGDDEDSYFFIDWETIEMFGSKEGFIEWLMYDLGLDAEDFYESVYGEYYMSPVGKVDDERDWLAGYPNVIVKGEQSGEDLPVQPTSAWPFDLLPEGTPEYPDGVFDVTDMPNIIDIYVSNTSKDTFIEYNKLLIDFGWDTDESGLEWGEGRGKKGKWELYYFISEDDTKVHLNFWHQN